MLHNIFRKIDQQRKIGEAKATAQRAQAEVLDAQSTIRGLQTEVAHLMLIVKTLLTACEQAEVFTEAQFRDLMDFIDERDGQRDGRLSPKRAPKACGSCAKTNAALARRCMYCGATFPASSLLDS